MSNQKSWDAAGYDLKAEKEKSSLDWYNWANANGFGPKDMKGYPYVNIHDAKTYWARDQFRAVLDTMPKDHPDRWKYVVGSKYAPKHYASSEDFFALPEILHVAILVIAHAFWLIVVAPAGIGLLLSVGYAFTHGVILLGLFAAVFGLAAVLSLPAAWIIYYFMRAKAMRNE